MLGAGPTAREAFFDFTCEPRLDAGGNVTGVRMIGVETTRIRHAQLLTAEHRALLEQIARQAPLKQVLEGMARAIEDLAPEEVLVSVLLADDDGRHLRHGRRAEPARLLQPGHRRHLPQAKASGPAAPPRTGGRW